jgi:hypothetical protein
MNPTLAPDARTDADGGAVWPTSDRVQRTDHTLPEGVRR